MLTVSSEIAVFGILRPPGSGLGPGAKAAQTFEKPEENKGFHLKPLKNLRKTILLGLGWARSGPNP